MAPEPATGSSFDRDPSEAAAALRALDPGRDRIVAYVGKLIGSKGVELLLAAFPLVLDARARRRGCSSSASARSARGWRSSRPRSRAGTSPRPGRCAASTGRSSRTSPPSSTRSTRSATRRWPAPPRARSHWAGRLEHEELTDVLPATEAFAMPSTFPEAFGMVAAEAAACGVLPVVAGHSGMAEVARSLAEAVDPQVAPWLTFQVGPGRRGGARRRARELARGA